LNALDFMPPPGSRQQVHLVNTVIFSR